MNTFIKFLLLVFLLGICINCSADGKKYWKQKLERYEQAKNEAVQKGETFDPNKFEEAERERKEKSNKEDWGPVILVLLGFAVFGVASIFLAGFLSKATKTENSEMAGCWGVIAMAIIIAAIAIIINFKGCSTSHSAGSDYQDDYWENARMHTNGNP